jgi:hypothetical protein
MEGISFIYLASYKRQTERTEDSVVTVLFGGRRSRLGCVRQVEEIYTDKKENQIFLINREIQMEQLQSHI